MLMDGLEAPEGALTFIASSGATLTGLSHEYALPPYASLGGDARADGSFPHGLVLFWSPNLAFAVRPPLPPGENAMFVGWDQRSLLDILGSQNLVAVLLLRRGGFSVGVFQGDLLVSSKTGRRFVKNRHRKGGQSQRRFDRIREKQVDELFDKTCELAWKTLSPFLPRLEAVFLGGDRRTVQAFRAQCAYLNRFGVRLQERFLPTPEPRQETLRLAYDMIWRSEWTELRPMAESGA